MCVGSADRVAPLRSIIHTAHDAPSLPFVVAMDVKQHIYLLICVASVPL